MEDLILRLTQLGYFVEIAPRQNLLTLTIKNDDDKLVTTQVGESYEDLFAKAIVKLGNDSINYRQGLIDKNRLSIL